MIAVAAQDKGDTSDLLPLAAVWRRGAGPWGAHGGSGRHVGRMRGYCRGGAAVDLGRHRLLGVSCPRGDLASFWDLGTLRMIGTVDLPDGCGLAAADAPGAFLLTSGRGGAVRAEPARPAGGAPPASIRGARALKREVAAEEAAQKAAPPAVPVAPATTAAPAAAAGPGPGARHRGAAERGRRPGSQRAPGGDGREGRGGDLHLGDAEEGEVRWRRYGNPGDRNSGSTSDIFSSGRTEIGLEFKPTDYLSGKLVLKSEYLGSDTTDGGAEADSAVVVDEATITFEQEGGFPLYFVIGKRTQPFGAYYERLVTDSPAKDAYEANQVGVTVGYKNQSSVGARRVVHRLPAGRADGPFLRVHALRQRHDRPRELGWTRRPVREHPVVHRGGGTSTPWPTSRSEAASRASRAPAGGSTAASGAATRGGI